MEAVAEQIAEVAPNLGIYAFLALWLAPGLFQLVAAPRIASRKGRDGALWFVVSVAWMTLHGGCAGYGVFFGWASFAISQSHPGASAALAVAAVAGFTTALIPLIVISVVPSKAERERPRQLRRRKARPRYRR